jgi:hypothetical protein
MANLIFGYGLKNKLSQLPQKIEMENNYKGNIKICKNPNQTFTDFKTLK